jgi:hypothetical protein
MKRKSLEKANTAATASATEKPAKHRAEKAEKSSNADARLRRKSPYNSLVCCLSRAETCSRISLTLQYATMLKNQAQCVLLFIQNYMSTTASDVAKLRSLTGAGMMDCKKALDEASGRHGKGWLKSYAKKALLRLPSVQIRLPPKVRDPSCGRRQHSCSRRSKLRNRLCMLQSPKTSNNMAAIASQLHCLQSKPATVEQAMSVHVADGRSLARSC